MAAAITLYDLPSKGHCASRAALNYKQQPYKTEWIEYPDIEPTFKTFGIPTNDQSVVPSAYSIPAVKMPDGKYVMESRAIADELERLKPSPSLHLGNGYVDRTQQAVFQILRSFTAIVMPLIPKKVLREPSVEYFERTRERRFGMPLTELAKSEKAGEAAWKEAEPHLQALKALLAEKNGPFIAGQEVSYADFILGGLWAFVKSVGKEHLYDRLISYDASFAAHEKAVSQYFERADH